MIVPKNIVFMCYAVDPVSGKIKRNKSDQISEESIGYLGNSQFIYHPLIADYYQTQSQYIFCYIGNA